MCTYHGGPGFEILTVIPSILTGLLFCDAIITCYLGKNKFDASINTFWLFGHPGKDKGHPKPAMKALDEDGWLTPCSGRLTPGNVPVPIVQETGWLTLRSGRLTPGNVPVPIVQEPG